jgi:hypothetical protein
VKEQRIVRASTFHKPIHRIYDIFPSRELPLVGCVVCEEHDVSLFVVAVTCRGGVSMIMVF